MLTKWNDEGRTKKCRKGKKIKIDRQRNDKRRGGHNID